jgi:2-oxo-4-hydroxy-4-carboxy-5-ureidoimidazoline decarboxylase
MNKSISLSQLNTIECDEFVHLLADTFEHSSWIPRCAYKFRPFESFSDLHSKMVAVIKSSTEEQQLSLLRAHPELAGKEARDGALTESSTSEQSHVGMNALNNDELLEVDQLNSQYLQKFKFPFIIAVLDNTKKDIFRKWNQRLSNSYEYELKTCLEQVYLIGKLRLAALNNEKIN